MPSQITLSSTTDGAPEIAKALDVKVDPPEASPKPAEPESGVDSGPAETIEEQPATAAEPAEETTEESVPADAEAADEDKPKPTKGKGGFQKRIDKLTADNHRLQQDNLRRQQELLDLQVRSAKTAPPESDELGPEPKMGDFQTIEDFLKADRSYQRKAISLVEAKATKAAQAEAEKIRTEFATRQAEADQARIGQAHLQREAEARTIYKDFDQVMDDAYVEVSRTVIDAIQNHPMGAHLEYQIAKNPEIADRLNALPERQQLLELGSIIAKLNPPKSATGQTKAQADSAPKRKASKAPKPIEPTAGSKATTVKDMDYWSKASYQEYKEARNSGRLK